MPTEDERFGVRSAGKRHHPRGRPERAFRDAVDNALQAPPRHPARQFLAYKRLAEEMGKNRAIAEGMSRSEIEAHEAADQLKQIRQLYRAVEVSIGGADALRLEAEIFAAMADDNSENAPHETARQLVHGGNDAGIKAGERTNSDAADYLGVPSIEEWVDETLGIAEGMDPAERQFRAPPRPFGEVLEALEGYNHVSGQAMKIAESKRQKDGGAEVG